ASTAEWVSQNEAARDLTWRRNLSGKQRHMRLADGLTTPPLLCSLGQGASFHGFRWVGRVPPCAPARSERPLQCVAGAHGVPTSDCEKTRPSSRDHSKIERQRAPSALQEHLPCRVALKS